ncbi:hypothetical protein BJF78_24215 [Pseudonocardia sp. CNS-139]|nr:hypothetical protein BJF78_24215 [Pseudonocardia sp. CNS-139]
MVDAVAISPIRSVAAAMAVRSVIGSSRPDALCAMSPCSAGPSAKNTASSFAASAVRAISW